MKGTFSGGTMASMLATLEAGRRDPGIVKTMINPYALAPALPQRQPRGDAVLYDGDIPAWATPFIMAGINTKNVHRTNALTNYRYGRDFTYDEMQSTGDGPAGERRAKAAANAVKMQMGLLAFSPTRALLRRLVLPKPGQGPSKHDRETGHYDVLFVGDMGEGDSRSLRASVTGDKDPGYGSTSKVIAEAALCLKDTSQASTPGGVWTAAAAMGEPLIARLREKAGLRFEMDG